ncbi:MAG: transcriptional repressor LexA [Oscillospiraceae bacterium]|nr:transcriptional repressor LexA [Oscillospiraceae bacterium]
MKPLTLKQQRIYDFIVEFTAQQGYPPSVREIAEAVGLKSPSTVHFHMKALEEAGVITKSAGKTRAITPNRQPEKNQIPVIGNVAAGSPILAEELVEDYLTFDAQGREDEHFALKIRGESMLKAGILPGDLVVVHRQSTANNGEIVIALFEEEATCKRFRRKDGHIWLLPENDDYQPIDGDNAELLGRVVAVVRRY